MPIRHPRARLDRSRIVAATISLCIAAASGAIAQASGPHARIDRDDWGVPHIHATSEEGGFYALGYAEAEDQLELLLRYYLTARGELAATFGAEHLESDFAARQWMHVEEARAGLARLSPQLRHDYEAFIAGVNRYMADHPGDVPAWAPTLAPWDPVAWSRALLWMGYQAGEGLQDCARGGVKLSASA